MRLLAGNASAFSGALMRLMKKNNYEADAVHTGAEALAYLRTGNYDGAILDLSLQYPDGISVISRARADNVHIPILVLSADGQVDDMVRALDSGANDFLSGLFNEKELLARIRVLTRSQSAQETSVLRMGNIALDRASLSLSSPVGSVHLTSKEYQILEMLLSNPRQIISAERLIERIWGYDGGTNMNVLWVHISYLRKKLVQIESDVQICCVRNAGYLVEETGMQSGALQ